LTLDILLRAMTPETHEGDKSNSRDPALDANTERDAIGAAHREQPTVHDGEQQTGAPGSRNATHSNMTRGWLSHQSRGSRNERRRSESGGSVDYDAPQAYGNLTEVSSPAPVQNPDDGADAGGAEPAIRRLSTREDGFDLEVGRQSARRVSLTRGHGSSVLGGVGSGSGDAVTAAPSHPRRLSQSSSASSREARLAARRLSITNQVEYDAPDEYANLAEMADVSPVQNPDEDGLYKYRSLEVSRSRDQEYIRSQKAKPGSSSAVAKDVVAGTECNHGQVLADKRPAENEPDLVRDGAGEAKHVAVPEFKVSRLATQIYTISYLVFFSFLGTLARIGLQALVTYSGTPIIFPSLWPNFGGSLVMGFLAEDRMLFRYEWGTPTYEMKLRQAKRQQNQINQSSGSSSSLERITSADLAAAKKAHTATKKTIPLYIGLATGFCGSFTSFSSFIRDMFLATSNDLAYPDITSPLASRNGGYSFMALIAVLLVTVTGSIGGLFVGAHLAIALEPITPSLPYLFMRKVLDRLVVLLAWGCWLGAVFLSVWPPDRAETGDGALEVWRGSATFALVFAPLGTLARFYVSLYLNGRMASFPLGTFVVNVFGTSILAMAWDLAHSGLGGVIGCQVLQGVEDGFCGCLTTVSTWVSELTSLRRRNAYIYGSLSVVVAYALMTVIMGSLRWTTGFQELTCRH
jgi:CrcB protein